MTKKLSVFTQNKTRKTKPISVNTFVQYLYHFLVSDFIPQKGQLGKTLWTFSCSESGIWWVKWNIFHQESIIAFSPSIFELQPTNRITEILVASIGTSLQIYMSSAKWNLGAAKKTFWPSKKFRNFCQDIISGDYCKSLMNITSAFSAPAKAYSEAVTLTIAYNSANSTFRATFNLVLSLLKLPCFWYQFPVYMLRDVSNKSF